MYESEKWAKAECSTDFHHILLNNTTILVSRSTFTDWLIREAVEISLHLCNMNRVCPQQILETPHTLPEEEVL
jgi:hypothetical protein